MLALDVPLSAAASASCCKKPGPAGAHGRNDYYRGSWATLGSRRRRAFCASEIHQEQGPTRVYCAPGKLGYVEYAQVQWLIANNIVTP